MNDSLHVLYVEDDPLDVTLITHALQEATETQFKVDVAGSLDDALRIATGGSHDIVLLDLTLPDSSGLVTLERFREHFPQLAIVVFSGDERKEIAYQAVNQGAQDYLFKNNINKQVLTLTIRYAIERKQAETALNDSYERFRLIVEGTSDGIWDWQDITKDEQYWSPRLKALLGYEDKEIDGSGALMLQLIHPDDKASVEDVMAPQPGNDQDFNIEFRVQTRQQGYRWFRAKGKVLRDSSNIPIRMLGAISDVSQYKEARMEQERLQAQLEQAHKLEAVGQLAAGVAHEMNTPIQFASDHFQFLSDAQQTLFVLLRSYRQAFATLHVEDNNRSLAEDIRLAEQRADLDFLIRRSPDAYKAVTDGLQRVTTIIKAMQRFSQPDTNDKALFDINQTIQDIIIVSGNIWRDIAEIKTTLPSTLPKIIASANGVNQVLLEIIINASQAIDIRRQQQTQHKGVISIHTEVQDKTIQVMISDNGAGIPQSIHHRVFEPFFTTREVGQGMGHGLSQAYTIIVEQHKGNIWFESEVDVGTRFYITLPL